MSKDITQISVIKAPDRRNKAGIRFATIRFPMNKFSTKLMALFKDTHQVFLSPIMKIFSLFFHVKDVLRMYSAKNSQRFLAFDVRFDCVHNTK